MAYRRKRFAPANKNSSFSLNITSMTDMFTILLVFLLQTYASSEIVVDVDRDIRLPSSNIQTTPVEALKISVSENELKLGDRRVANLEKGQFLDKDLEKSDSQFILPLFKELEKESKNTDGKVLLLAHSSLSYHTLKKVMYTASMAGFPKLKIAALAGQ